MTMRWRVRVLYLAFCAGIGLLFAIPATRAVITRPWALSRIAAVAVVFVILGTFYGFTFLIFRCPHCGARQIRGRWDWLFVGERCWKCDQLLDGPAVPTEVLDEQLVAEQNPGLAADMRRDRLALEDLAQRALTDPAAAAQFDQALETEVERLRGWAALVHRESPSAEPDASQSLARAEQRLAQWRAVRRLTR